MLALMTVALSVDVSIALTASVMARVAAPGRVTPDGLAHQTSTDAKVPSIPFV